MAKAYDHLYDEIFEFSRLRRAYYRASKSKGDRLAILKFNHNLEKNLFRMQKQLRENSYLFGPYRSFYVYEPKKRLIESACFPDQVVHHVLFETLEPIFDSQFYEHSYACRSGRGHHNAMLQLKKWMRPRKHQWFLKCDIKKYFPSINRKILLKIIERTIVDQRILELIEKLVVQAPRQGLPIGNLG